MFMYVWMYCIMFLLCVCIVFIRFSAFSLCFIPIILMCGCRILIKITYLLTVSTSFHSTFNTLPVLSVCSEIVKCRRNNLSVLDIFTVRLTLHYSNNMEIFFDFTERLHYGTQFSQHLQQSAAGFHAAIGQNHSTVMLLSTSGS